MQKRADECVDEMSDKRIAQYIQRRVVLPPTCTPFIGDRVHLAFQVIMIEQSLKSAEEKKMYRNLLLLGTMTGIAGGWPPLALDIPPIPLHDTIPAIYLATVLYLVFGATCALFFGDHTQQVSCMLDTPAHPTRRKPTHHPPTPADDLRQPPTGPFGDQDHQDLHDARHALSGDSRARGRFKNVKRVSGVMFLSWRNN